LWNDDLDDFPTWRSSIRTTSGCVGALTLLGQLARESGSDDRA
jgi:hypothetical protein